jgi:hypothetical protein
MNEMKLYNIFVDINANLLMCLEGTSNTSCYFCKMQQMFYVLKQVSMVCKVLPLFSFEGECKLKWFIFCITMVISTWCIVFRCLWWIT